VFLDHIDPICFLTLVTYLHAYIYIYIIRYKRVMEPPNQSRKKQSKMYVSRKCNINVLPGLQVHCFLFLYIIPVMQHLHLIPKEADHLPA
jgi:hypothetical protein